MSDPLQPYLITGGEGMLARAWRETAARRGLRFRAVGRRELDIADPDAVRAVIAAVRPGCVINCAAWANVDGAESDPAGAWRANAVGPGVLAAACRDAGVPVVHYGTDYVFNGDAPPGDVLRPWRIDDPTGPVNEYGRGKLAGEVAVREAAGPDGHLILRTSWLYAPWGKNFVRTITALARTKPELKVVNDQTGRPTSAEELADVTLRLLAKGARGTLHATDGGYCTWYEFACLLASATGSSCLVRPCTTAEFPRPARRPSWSVLDLAPTEAIIGQVRQWRETLAEVLPRLEP